MFRFMLALIAALLLWPAPAQAQDAPDYIIGSYIVPNYSDDGTQVTLAFTVYNQGGPASQRAGVEVRDVASGALVVSQPGAVPALQRGETVDVTVAFAITRYAPGSTPLIEIIVGRDEIEAEAAPSFADNRVRTGLLIPPYDAAAQAQGDLPTPVPDTAPPGFPTAQPEAKRNVLTIPIVEIEADLDDPATALILSGIVLAVAIMALILLLLLRLLFVRTPSFGTWQPPYASMPRHDPNTTAGRRQQWQTHAQNNVVSAPCHMGTVLPRKVLLGSDGAYLSGWRVVAARLTQYDMYGRVSRSEVLAPGGVVKRLHRLAQKGGSLNERQIKRRAAPIARALVRPFRKRVSRRSAMLSIALDLRLRGQHGEVGILFELYECRGRQPVLLDSWMPEMTVLGRAIHESYTFTLFGQGSSESYRAFRRRLYDDVLQAVMAFARLTVFAPPPSADVVQALAPPTPPSRPQAPPIAAADTTESLERIGPEVPTDTIPSAAQSDDTI